ncbi:MAG: 50S ribosomal protein L18e [Methanosarcinales archaeon]|nr:50S ribosomal protein L18e [ANME-2 cluster archaeon]MDF1531030.1 50S ribosomal protein L18e [ANME-2 cluster archaeon]MDW7775486.1 50S ribosomal protein L18e [Methanosarcinales archaeon]
MSKNIKKTNLRVSGLINDLKTASRENDVKIWRDIALRLSRPTRNYSEVNLSKINRHSSEDETIIVPGKVLASGTLEHKVNVVALGFSGTAKEKIVEKGGLCLTIEQLVKENPSGSNVRIMQ